MGIGDGSPASPAVVDHPASPMSVGDGLFDEDGEELEMHSKAFHTIGELKAMRSKAAADGNRCVRSADWTPFSCHGHVVRCVIGRSVGRFSAISAISALPTAVGLWWMTCKGWY